MSITYAAIFQNVNLYEWIAPHDLINCFFLVCRVWCGGDLLPETVSSGPCSCILMGSFLLAFTGIDRKNSNHNRLPNVVSTNYYLKIKHNTKVKLFYSLFWTSHTAVLIMSDLTFEIAKHRC